MLVFNPTNELLDAKNSNKYENKPFKCHNRISTKSITFHELSVVKLAHNKIFDYCQPVYCCHKNKTD